MLAKRLELLQDVVPLLLGQVQLMLNLVDFVIDVVVELLVELVFYSLWQVLVIEMMWIPHSAHLL